MRTPSTDHESIVQLLKDGKGPAEIIELLGLTMSKRQIQKIAQQNGIVRLRQTNGRLQMDGLGTGPLQTIIEYCLVTHRGLDPYTCGDCGKHTIKKCDIHHQKYAGATIYDLAFVCRSCNLATRNVGLA